MEVERLTPRAAFRAGAFVAGSSLITMAALVRAFLAATEPERIAAVAIAFLALVCAMAAYRAKFAHSQDASARRWRKMLAVSIATLATAVVATTLIAAVTYEEPPEDELEPLYECERKAKREGRTAGHCNVLYPEGPR